jgi:hypothetical protein
LRAVIVLATGAGIQVFAWAAHNYGMHGWGWHASLLATRTHGQAQA